MLKPKVNFEITTYRMDLEYQDKRKPSKIVYTDKLIIDLRRRDFTMNTLCMDKNKNIIDLLNARNNTCLSLGMSLIAFTRLDVLPPPATASTTALPFAL